MEQELLIMDISGSFYITIKGLAKNLLGFLIITYNYLFNVSRFYITESTCSKYLDLTLIGCQNRNDTAGACYKHLVTYIS